MKISLDSVYAGIPPKVKLVSLLKSLRKMSSRICRDTPCMMISELNAVTDTDISMFRAHWHEQGKLLHTQPSHDAFAEAADGN